MAGKLIDFLLPWHEKWLEAMGFSKRTRVEVEVVEIFDDIVGRKPTKEERDRLVQWYEQTYPWMKEKKEMGYEIPRGRYVAVFNSNPEGVEVVRLVSVGPGEMNYSENQVTESAKVRIIREVQRNLPSGHKVNGISNLLPSVSGMGGAYVFPVRLEVPEPRWEVNIGPVIKTLSDL